MNPNDASASQQKSMKKQKPPELQKLISNSQKLGKVNRNKATHDRVDNSPEGMPGMRRTKSSLIDTDQRRRQRVHAKSFAPGGARLMKS